jgi:hypothetical protein
MLLMLCHIPSLCWAYSQPNQQSADPTQHQACGPASKEDIEFPPAEQTRLRTKGPWCNKIPSKCGVVYIGQTGCSMDISLNERQRQIWLEHPGTLPSQDIAFSFTIPPSSPLDHIVKEAIEIVSHPNSMNREAGFCLSKSWKPLICCLNKSSLREAKPSCYTRLCHARYESTL